MADPGAEPHGILPLVFGGSRASTQPSLTLVVGQPGAGKSLSVRSLLDPDDPSGAVISADDLAAFHPDFLRLARRSPLDAPSAMAPLVADWITESLAFARTSKRSLVLELSVRTPSAAFATAEGFAVAGFATRIVVVAARRSESLLSTASRYFNARRVGMPARFTDRATHNQGWAGTQVLVREAEAATPVDRLSIVSRDGSVLFDAKSDDGFAGATAALEAAQRAPIRSIAAAEWFGELRRVMDFATATRELAPPVTEVLIELHELALGEVLPLVGTGRNSTFSTQQRARLSADLASLRRALPREEPRFDPAAPIITPPAPTRGGPSL
ncbi:hypothetical protein GCM10009777_10520 [Microbacterium pumilum]|uniref:UDP-N-acetylglucosamine kinase n=1 Tax=Microbacterium pumilum TaxID=344165 RepID=A0ABN2S293_9MICO